MRLTSLFGRRLAAPLVIATGVVVAGLAYTNAVPRAATTGKPVAAAAAAPLNTATYADAVSRVMPAVVTIEVEKRVDTERSMVPDEFLQRFFGQEGPRLRQLPDQRETGLGSGVILTQSGNIVTNNHVVEGADRVTVQLADGRQFPGKVVGTDPPTDLAVVHIDATGLPTVPVGNSDRLRVGDVVLAVGNPLGIGETVTMGIVSAKGRATDSGDGTSYEDFIQTDAAINRGNSGGALVTTTGDLVGINAQIMSPSGGNIGIGFAIPSNVAENVMTQLVSTGHVRRGMLGVTVQRVTSDMARSLGLASVQGAIVDQVNAGSPGEKAGLEPGDVILKVNGQPVDDSNSLRNHVSALAPGTAVTLDVFRHGESKQLTATLGEMAEAKTQAAHASAQPNDLGMTLEALTPSLVSRLNVPHGTTGVAVTDLDPSGVAARAGIRSGDVLTQLNGQPVTSPAQVRDILAAHHDRPVLAAVIREARRLYVALPTA